MRDPACAGLSGPASRAGRSAAWTGRSGSGRGPEARLRGRSGASCPSPSAARARRPTRAPKAGAAHAASCRSECLSAVGCGAVQLRRGLGVRRQRVFLVRSSVVRQGRRHGLRRREALHRLVRGGQHLVRETAHLFDQSLTLLPEPAACPPPPAPRTCRLPPSAAPTRARRAAGALPPGRVSVQPARRPLRAPAGGCWRSARPPRRAPAARPSRGAAVPRARPRAA